MNLFRLSPYVALVALASPALLGATMSTDTPATRPKVLLQVEAPFAFDPIYRDDVASAFYTLLERALVTTNRSLTVEQRNGSDLRADQPLLTVTLLSWRNGHLGDIECRIMAHYQVGDARESLGIFEGRQLAILRSRSFVANDFERAGESAARQLRDALLTRGLL